jgi:hypothetical protein
MAKKQKPPAASEVQKEIDLFFYYYSHIVNIEKALGTKTLSTTKAMMEHAIENMRLSIEAGKASLKEVE